MIDLIQVVFLIISMSTNTHQLFYVLPDNSTQAHCPFQPCATLSQYLLDNNGSLPVMSNVEYRFLPGEHHVPTNMKFQYLQNFVIVGNENSASLSTVMIGGLQTYLEILDSINVTIKNMVFKRPDMFAILYEDYNSHLYNLAFKRCFSCKIVEVQFMKLRFYGEDLCGNSHLTNVLVSLIASPFCCIKAIHIVYTNNNYLLADNYSKCTIIMNKIFMSGESYDSVPNTGIQVFLPSTNVSKIKIIVGNSYFKNMDQATILDINIHGCTTNSLVVIENCTFRHNEYFQILDSRPMIDIKVAQINVTLHFVNCSFLNNYQLPLLSIIIYDSCKIPTNTSCAFSSKILIKVCLFLKNTMSFLKLVGSKILSCVNVYVIGPVTITDSEAGSEEVMHIENSIVHVNGPLYLSENHAIKLISIYSSDVLFHGLIITSNKITNVLMQFQFSHILFKGPITISKNIGSVLQTHSCNATISGPIKIFMNQKCRYVMLLQFSDVLFNETISFQSNLCQQIIVLKSNKETSYIKIMEYSNISFTQNNNSNPIAVEIKNNSHNFYPYCFFQYIASKTTWAILPSHYSIVINDRLLGNCKLSFYHFTSHCKWISKAVFYGKCPKLINQQIVQLNNKFSYHTTIFYCTNFSINTLGPVYPGQILKIELCMPCSNNYSILYAETNNILLPKSACKIAHQTEIVNLINNNSKTVSYTIVSEVNDSCELFLTVSPFLYDIYEVFDVQLLPCPIGFTLQNGVCNCDPLLPTGIDTCYIDQSAIRRPANTWISYTQSGNSKYLISDCPMDYCLPFSSNVNLLYPDTQCQFSRTGILCSQCKRSLSMVFGSSKCMKCTDNVHILITLIVVVAGIVLVALLYFLNVTVTNGTINGIILYANIININDSIFLNNDNALDPLKVFISFVNLDLGIETCFYNGMDNYTKLWLQLFFPTYLIFIAFTIIIASRYSSRILRLTYSRSLPVLATLFLLSYTSVLRTVLTVLFSYSTITYAPSGQQELVWSVDASVPLFGLKFTILFIICLALLLIILFFNIIMLFARYLIHFNLTNGIKHLLVAFFASYKAKCYYWIATQMTLRSTFITLYVFQEKIRLLFATFILVSFTGLFGYICPYKNKLVNFQELSLLINLTIMYAVTHQSSNDMIYIITNLMISLAFIQFCIIVLYHFLTYTCNCKTGNTFQFIRKLY